MNVLSAFVTIIPDTGFFDRGVSLGVTFEQQEALLKLLQAYGIDADHEQTRLLLLHLELLTEKNESLNLTRVTSAHEAFVAHILDSLLPLPYLNDCFAEGNVSFLDIGTGGGFPGLPLAIMTGWKATLIDSIGKKVAAVNEFVSLLGLTYSVEALHVRAEDLARVRPQSFDVVVTRAVAQSNVLIEYAAPLLRQGGMLVLYKARPSDEELQTANRAAKLCGMKFVSRETFELPDDAGHREIYFLKKVDRASVKLPRRAGMALKEPLGL